MLLSVGGVFYNLALQEATTELLTKLKYFIAALHWLLAQILPNSARLFLF